MTKVQIEPRYAIRVDAFTLLATLTLHLTILLTKNNFSTKSPNFAASSVAAYLYAFF